MTKRELVMEIAERFGFPQNEVSDIVQATLDTITESLAQGERLEIRNFGVFEVKTRDPRVGRNPRTGEEVPIAPKRVATFKPGKALKELVQTGDLDAYEASQAQSREQDAHADTAASGSRPAPRLDGGSSISYGDPDDPF